MSDPQRLVLHPALRGRVIRLTEKRCEQLGPRAHAGAVVAYRKLGPWRKSLEMIDADMELCVASVYCRYFGVIEDKSRQHLLSETEVEHDMI